MLIHTDVWTTMTYARTLTFLIYAVLTAPTEQIFLHRGRWLLHMYEANGLSHIPSVFFMHEMGHCRGR